MDSTILQLFALEEIFDRIGHKQLTGSFHIFSPGASADVYFEKGRITSAIKGAIEGEEALEQILDWKDPRWDWEPNAVPPTTRKPLNLLIGDFFARRRKANGVTRSATSRLSTALSPRSLILIQASGSTTGPLHDPSERRAPPTDATITSTAKATGSVNLTATKPFNPPTEARTEQDEELLKRFHLVLVSEEKPEKRFRIAQITTLAGRHPACNITISHPSISRQHCLLQLTERGLLLKDLGTTNGTKVNGTVLKEGYVNVGDKLTIGHLHFTLEKE